ncbi:MAG: hypothetical protein HND47_10225 [Chloroflexi bacterium]|nr:hypothetical protein [Chloroflexota bacterium]
MAGKNDKARKDPEDDDGNKTGSWAGFRPIAGSVLIVLLMVFEYMFISIGFKQPNPNDPTPNGWGWGWPISILVPMAGVMAFFGVMLISNVFSKNPDLSHGEMRKAITAGIVVTYIFFIMTTLFSGSSPVYKLVAPATPAPTEEASPSPQGDAGLYAVAYLQETPPPPTEEAGGEPTEEPTEAADDSAGSTADDAAQPAAEDSIDTPLELAASIVNAFTTLVGVVVGFYFTSRSFDSYVDKQLIAKNPELAKLLNKEEQ